MGSVQFKQFLSGAGVFSLTTTVNYNDKVIMYERGIVKTEIIDGKEFTGKEPDCPYQVIELDNKTGKIKVYRTELVYEEDMGVEFAKGFNTFQEQIDFDSNDMVSLYR